MILNLIWDSVNSTIEVSGKIISYKLVLNETFTVSLTSDNTSIEQTGVSSKQAFTQLEGNTVNRGISKGNCTCEYLLVRMYFCLFRLTGHRRSKYKASCDLDYSSSSSSSSNSIKSKKRRIHRKIRNELKQSGYHKSIEGVPRSIFSTFESIRSEPKKSNNYKVSFTSFHQNKILKL